MTANTKSYVALVEFLTANANKKVSSILPEILEMTEAKQQAKTFIADENGNVMAIYCYYHKQWELLVDAEYGLKASSTTGYNTMCKVGVKYWTLQQKNIKAVGETILTMLENEEITIEELSTTKERLIDEAKEINVTNMPQAYEG